MTRITRGNRVRDPNGRILEVGLRLPGGMLVLPADAPSWRSVTVGVLSLLHGAGVPLRAVRAGESGRLLLAQRDGWAGEDGERSEVEDIGWFLRTEPMNAHAYLSVIFEVLPPEYGDEDFWVRYTETSRRPKVRRGSKKYGDDEPDLDFFGHQGG